MPTSSKNTIRSLVAALIACAISVAGLGASPASAVEDDVLNASEMELGEITSDVTVGRYTVTASGANPVEVDENNKTGGGMSFTQRLKLNGSGNEDERSVAFTTDDEATVTAYILSSSGSEDRALALYDANGAEIARAPAYAGLSDIPAATLVVPEAGDYYVASPDSGVNIYYLETVEGPPPERPAWDEVAAPTITDVGVSDGEIVVAYDGVVGFDGADIATATLFDADGNEVDSNVSGTPGDSGSIGLAPSASGEYEVEVALSRNDEESVKTSERVAAPSFTLPLAEPEIHTALTSEVDGDRATVTVEWTEVPEAEGYSLDYRDAGATDWTAGPSADGTQADVTDLVPGTTYEFRVTAERGEDTAVSEPYEVEVTDEVERWLTAHAGISSHGSLEEREDGSLHWDLIGNNGKLADSEDGFLYHYTEIDPESENFTLSATFTVEDASGKDNQSGFGIVAVDTFVPNDRTAKYFNNAGVMSAKYRRQVDGSFEYRYGMPGSKIVTGYTDPDPHVSTPDRDWSRSEAFDWDYRADYTEGSNDNPPKFQDGDTYEYTLRKSNTGFHAIWTRDGEEQEIIDYDPDMLLQQDPDRFYVGLFAARNIEVTASNIEFTTIHPDDDDPAMEPPTEYIDPTVSSDVTRTTPHHEIDVPLESNIHGAAELRDGDGDVLDEAALSPDERVEVEDVPLEDGTNELTVEVTPAPKEEQTQLGEYEDLSSYNPFTYDLTIEVDRFGSPGQAIIAAPDGTPDGDGSPRSPLDLHTAVGFAQPGQQVILEEGTYRPDHAIEIDRGNDGTAEKPITLMSRPDSRATLDLSESSSGGIKVRGDHWRVSNLEITKSQGYEKPLLIEGSHNVVEFIESHHNGDTGVQISLSPGASASRDMWPSDNLVRSSVSHDNADPLGNDADGFAAKLTVGDGNVFRYCISHHNIDDGYDLYAKSTTGPIGDVVIEDSVAYRNGWLQADPDATGEGNGFKLGGESMPGAHLLRNSVSYDNLAKGITSNSGPDVRVHDVTSYRNGAMNLQMTTSAESTDYEASGVLSYRGGESDQIDLRDQEDTISDDRSNHLNDTEVQDRWFESLDLDVVPAIADDGSVDMKGLLELTDGAPDDTGARLGPNPSPTEIQPLPPVRPEPGPSHTGQTHALTVAGM